MNNSVYALKKYLLICAILGLCEMKNRPYYNSKYHLTYVGLHTAKDTNSDKLCTHNNSSGWILEIYDDDVNQLLKELVSRNKTNDILLNTEVKLSKWTWTNNNPFSGHINNGDPKKSLAAYVSNSNNPTSNQFEYHSDNFKHHHKVLCQKKENSTDCKSNNGLFHSNLCYFPLHEKYTWFDAHNKCIKNGGGLAVLDNLDLNDMDQSWTQNLGQIKYWIGLTKVPIYWKHKGTIINYNKWLDGYPPYDLQGHKCITANTDDDNKWVNVDCNQVVSVVCMSESVSFQAESAKLKNNDDVVFAHIGLVVLSAWIVLGFV